MNAIAVLAAALSVDRLGGADAVVLAQSQGRQAQLFVKRNWPAPIIALPPGVPHEQQQLYAPHGRDRGLFSTAAANERPELANDIRGAIRTDGV